MIDLLVSNWHYAVDVAIVWAAVAVVTNLLEINRHLRDLRAMQKVRFTTPSDELDALRGIYTHLKAGDGMAGAPLVSILNEIRRLNDRLEGRP